MHSGDTLVVTRVDRLARSIGDLQDVVRALKAKGVALKATEQPIDTSTAAGEAFLDMLSVFAESGINLRRKRQVGGIMAAKARGVQSQGLHTHDRRGRGPSPARGEELGLAALVRQLGRGSRREYSAFQVNLDLEHTGSEFQ